MQVVVSMYLETVGTDRMPEWLPQTEAEERRMSRLMALLPSRFLEFDEEGLELRRPGIQVHRRRRREVGKGTSVAVRRFVPPVQREADLPEGLPVDLERTEALGHHRHTRDRAARRGDLHLRPIGDSLLLRQRLGNLDEEPGLELVQDLCVFGPVVVVL